MNLSISNIGWIAENDAAVYGMMRDMGFKGLEIAPTRIFPERPYERNDKAATWSGQLKDDYGFAVASMQSIWYGRAESIFGTDEDRKILSDYTKKAIDFAQAIGCNNLVFGCPKNRNVPEGVNADTAIDFFRELGDYALAHDTVIGMEANPPIYNTNYVNYTSQAIELIERVGSEGFRLNLDIGTMVCLEENADILQGKMHLVNHVHISEPGLKPIEERQIHGVIKNMLRDGGYAGFVSIEMGKCDDLGILKKAMEYVSGVFV